MLAMPIELCREADLSLRGPGRFVRPRVSWPPGDSEDNPIAVVLADGEWDRALADALCAAGFVVLSLRTAAIDVATIALEWAADHARELGADPERLIVVGGRLAAAVALEARNRGWPEISRYVYVQEPISFEWIRGLRD
jgi:hypothetical protein